MFIPKKILYLIGGVGLLVLGIFIGLSFGNEKINSPLEQTAVVSTAVQYPSLVKVVRVVDGDTINVEINGQIEPVRYIGIDTPETVDPRKPVQREDLSFARLRFLLKDND